MYEDYLLETKDNTVLANNKLLQTFSKQFQDKKKSNSDYSLPEPEETKTELDIEKLKYDPKQQKEIFDTLMASNPPTIEQEPYLNEVFHCIDNNINKVFIVQGQGGSGKTKMAQIIAAYARWKKHIALGCASTAFAASIYKDFYTAHGLFEIPVIEDEETYDTNAIHQSNVHKKPQRVQLLKHCKLFIWDEISSQHLRDIKAIFDVMDQFKNHILIIQGDYRQIAPVIQNGKKEQIISASIYCSEMIKKFTKIEFTINLRLKNNNEIEQKRYGEMLLEIANGTHFKHLGEKHTNQVYELFPNCSEEYDGETPICFNSIETTIESTDAISWITPDGFDPLNISKNCILAVTNKQVDYWNTEVQKLNPNEKHTLYSYDTFHEVDDPHGYIQEMITEEIMNKFSDNQAPTYQLELKINDICILLGNYNREDGLTKNTRVRIVNITRKLIKVVTINTDYPIFALIPRYIFYLKLPYNNSFKIMRKQFPLRLAYALTMNRSQGQEFEKLLIDLSEAAFTHGHLYVALSRIRLKENLKIFCNQENLMDLYCGFIVTKNVVYNEILNGFKN